MNTGVKQIWTATLPDGAKVGTTRQPGKESEAGFADAVKSADVDRKPRDARLGHGADREGPLRPEFKLSHRLASEPLAAKARPDMAGDPNLDELEGAIAEPEFSQDEPVAGREMAAMFRLPPPPMVLPGKFGLHAAGASTADLSGPTDPAPSSTNVASPFAEAGKTSSAAEIALPAQGRAKAATAEPAAAAAAGADQDSIVKPAVADIRSDVAAGAKAGAKPAADGPTAFSDAVPVSKMPRAKNGDVPEAQGQASRVTVLAQQNIPAPATPLPGLTAAPLLSAVAADGSWRELAATNGLRDLPVQNAVASTHSLKVQLRPAELGMVTASLRFSGEQLTVELQVESAEAQQRLSADSDTIVKSLRALGLEVDRVTIQQSPVANTQNARADANAGQNGQPAPDRQSFNAANSGGGNGQAGGQQPGRSNSNGVHGAQNTASGSQDRAGSGLYI